MALDDFFPGFNFDGQVVFPGGHGTGSKRSEGTGRIVGPVEIEDYPATVIGTHIHKPAPAVGI